jgi:Spy/CpxP family protein refolding chaperone
MISYETLHARGKPLAALFAAWLLLPLLLLSAAAPSARAQGQDARPDDSQEGEALPQQRPRRGGANLLLRLNLTPEQLAQLREIRGQSVPQERALLRRLNAARRALDEAIYADEVSDALVEERTAELSQALTALARLRAQTELRVRRVLTAEQLRSFRDLRQRARQRQRAQRRLDRRNRRQQQSGPAGRPALRPEAPANTTPGQRPAPQPPAGRRP